MEENTFDAWIEKRSINQHVDTMQTDVMMQNNKTANKRKSQLDEPFAIESTNRHFVAQKHIHHQCTECY